jgi:hypothetical protein
MITRSSPGGAPPGQAGDTGTTYLIHFDRRYRHAGHYLGWTTDLDARLEAHRTGRGARLMEVVTGAGITWHLARTGRAASQVGPPQPAAAVQPRPRPPAADPRERGASMAEHFLQAQIQPGRTAGQIEAAYENITRPFREAPQHTAAQATTFSSYTGTVMCRLEQLRDAERQASGQAEQEAEAGA